MACKIGRFGELARCGRSRIVDVLALWPERQTQGCKAWVPPTARRVPARREAGDPGLWLREWSVRPTGVTPAPRSPCPYLITALVRAVFVSACVPSGTGGLQHDDKQDAERGAARAARARSGSRRGATIGGDRRRTKLERRVDEFWVSSRPKRTVSCAIVRGLAARVAESRAKSR